MLDLFKMFKVELICLRNFPSRSSYYDDDCSVRWVPSRSLMSVLKKTKFAS